MRAGSPNPPWLAADVAWAADRTPAAGPAPVARVTPLAGARPVVPAPAVADPLVPAAYGHLAVALHDVEPATQRRCAEVREWLRGLGVDRVTLLVIPAPRMHPFPARSPELAYWLLDRQDAGDAIAQHGLHHRQTRPRPRFMRPVRRRQGGAAAEYAGLGAEAAAESVEAGRRVLEGAGLHVRGFVAPAYAYTGALRGVLDERFDWWATLLAHHAGATTRSPALGLGTSSPLKRAVSPLLLRAGATLAPRVLRLDLHPDDFDHPRHVTAVERVLERARDRVAVTYDDLAAGFGGAGAGVARAT